MVVVATGIIFFLFGGTAFWIESRTNVAACLWGNAACSLTIATYLLCGITAGAFIAAAVAAQYAYGTWLQGNETLNIERSMVLGQRLCDNRGHKVDIPLYIGEDYRFYDGKPKPLVSFDQMDFEFISLGRSPIVNAIVDVYCYFSNAEADQHSVIVGSMRSDASVHCTFWIHTDVLRNIENIEWSAIGARCEGGPLQFKPLRPSKPEMRGKRNIDPSRLSGRPTGGPVATPGGEIPEPPPNTQSP